MSWITVGEDSISYWDAERGPFDPIERVRRWGAAFTATVPDLVTGEVFLDEETNLSWPDRRQSFGYEGWSFEALGIVRWSSADRIDPEGGRFETQVSTQYIVDAKRLWRLYKRASTGKLLSPDPVEMDGFPLPPGPWRGSPSRPTSGSPGRIPGSPPRAPEVSGKGRSASAGPFPSEEGLRPVSKDRGVVFGSMVRGTNSPASPSTRPFHGLLRTSGSGALGGSSR